MAFYEGRDYRLVEELMDRCMSGEASQVSAYLRKYFTIIVRKYVIGGNAEHPSRNRIKHLAPKMASFLI